MDPVCCVSVCVCRERFTLKHLINRHTNRYTHSSYRPFLADNQAFCIKLANHPIGFVVGNALVIGREGCGQCTDTLMTCIPHLQRTLQLVMGARVSGGTECDCVGGGK